MQSVPATHRSILISLVIGLHVLLFFTLIKDTLAPPHSKSPLYRRSDLIFLAHPAVLPQALPQTSPRAVKPASSTQDQTRPRKVPAYRTISPEISAPPLATSDALPQAEQKPAIQRDIATISAALARESRFEQDKIQAAKPPNQLVREYWEAQRHPYKDKWDELAQKMEKAGVARGVKMETYTSWDGTQITKIDGTCYKAPDPGRTYLRQPEVRKVICPR